MTITLLAAVTLVNFAAALRGYQSSLVEAEQLFNDRMVQDIDLLNYTLPALRAKAVIASGTIELPTREPDAGHNLAFQWLDSENNLIARSANMPDTPVAALNEGFSYANFNGYRWHVLVARSADQLGWFIVGERDDQRYRMVESIILPAVYPMVIAMPALGIIIWTVLGIGLKPVNRLATDLGQREATDLHPLSQASMPTELRQLVTSTNALLHRLESSFAREKRFSADAAHELRTPIAALSIQCENLGFAAPEHAIAVQKIKLGVERMHHIVNQILMLSRVTPDHYVGSFAPLNLAESAREAIAALSAALSDKEFDVEFVGVDLWITGDFYAVQSLLGNLIENAIKYSPVGGRLRIQLQAEDGRAVLSVSDSGVGIPAAQRDRVFDRFYRIGGDRHDSLSAGCGLGLSIVRQVADLHQATIAFADSPFETGLTVTVSFPRLAAPHNRRRHTSDKEKDDAAH